MEGVKRRWQKWSSQQVLPDKGASRAQIHDLLIKLGIPFIDVGMGLIRDGSKIGGLLKTTYDATINSQALAEKRLAPMKDNPDDIYKDNIQIQN